MPHSVPDLQTHARAGYVVAPTTHVLKLADRAALFCSRRQQLLELNHTALAIWETLAEGGSTFAAAAHLRAQEASADEAAQYVAQAAADWMLGGHLAPAEAADRLRDAPLAIRDVGLDGFAARLRLHDPEPLSDIEAAFGHLSVGEAKGCPELDLIETDDGYVLFLDGAPWGLAEPEGVVPLLKATLTELYAESVTDGFLTHGALLEAEGHTLFLTGEPGAGKTTLTLALAARGMAYGGDDIVRITSEGLAAGAHFAAAVKSGAWDLLSGRLRGLADEPVHTRADGQEVRYALPPIFRGEAPTAIDLILHLRREAGADPHFAPLHPLDALCLLLGSGFSRKAAADAATLKAVAARLERARAYVFTYSDLDAAVAAVESLA